MYRLYSPKANNTSKGVIIDLPDHPNLKKIENIISKLSTTDGDLVILEKLTGELQDYIQDRIKKSARIKKGFDINEEGLTEWLQHYWTWEKIPIYHDGKFVRFEIIISIPKIWNETIGWFYKSDIGYNKFKVNSVTNIMGLLPDYIREELDFPEPLDIKFGENNSYVTGKDIDKLSEKYSHHLSKITKDRAYLKPNSYYEFIRELVRNNTNPFDYNPISKDLFEKKKSNVVLRDYQKKSLQKFYDYSRILILYPTGVGKTYVALQAMNDLKPPFIIFSGNSTTSTQQWKSRIETYCPDLQESDYDIFTYQGAFSKILDKEYTLGIFDEAHHLPAKQWINVTKIKMKLAMGLTASPYREDEGGDEMIVALTGIPDMPDWDYFMKRGIIVKPECNIWLVKNIREKQSTLDKILEKKLKTIVFCDMIEEGNSLSKRYGVPFVYGQTDARNRIDIVNSNLLTIVSRVFDESASIPELERTIEFMYHGKSRRQELQRIGRGLHQQDKTKTPIHHIIMLFEDFEKDKSRLVILSEKDFQVKWHYDKIDMAKITKRLVVQSNSRPKRKTTIQSSTVEIKKVELNEDEYPIMKNARVKKIFSMLSKGDVTAFIPFLRRERTQNGWTVRELMDEYAILQPMNVNRKFRDILTKSYIVKKGDRYVQNIIN